MDLEKAFDRVPRYAVRRALQKMGVEVWLVGAVMAMYTEAVTLRFGTQSAVIYICDGSDDA